MYFHFSSLLFLYFIRRHSLPVNLPGPFAVISIPVNSGHLPGFYSREGRQQSAGVNYLAQNALPTTLILIPSQQRFLNSVPFYSPLVAV